MRLKSFQKSFPSLRLGIKIWINRSNPVQRLSHLRTGACQVLVLQVGSWWEQVCPGGVSATAQQPEPGLAATETERCLTGWKILKILTSVPLWSALHRCLGWTRRESCSNLWMWWWDINNIVCSSAVLFYLSLLLLTVNYAAFMPGMNDEYCDQHCTALHCTLCCV